MRKVQLVLLLGCFIGYTGAAAVVAAAGVPWGRADVPGGRADVPGGRASAAYKPDIAVLGVYTTALTKKESPVISQFLYNVYKKHNKYFNIISMDKIPEITGIFGSGAAASDIDSINARLFEYAVQAGARLGVDMALIGHLYRKGQNLYLKLLLVDVEKQVAAAQKTMKTNSINRLYNLCEEVYLRVKDQYSGSAWYEPIVADKSLGIGLIYPGISLKYYRKYLALESRFMSGEESILAGARIYINAFTHTWFLIYFGAEYLYINGKTPHQNFTGRLVGSFTGIETRIKKDLNLYVDIEPSVIDLQSEYANVSISNIYIIGNLGINYYFKICR